MSENGGVLPSTIGGQSINRYAMEHQEAIREEQASFNNQQPLNNKYFAASSNENFIDQTTVDNHQSNATMMPQQMSQTTLTGPPNVLRQELLLCKK